MFKVNWWRTSFGEEEVKKLAESVANQRISHGKVTEEFEKQFAEAMDVPYALAATSGSTALVLALMAFGIGRDDEVIIPDRTWIATAHAVLMVGARVVLVDVRPDIPLIDVEKIREKITSKTKAIIPVHLNGRSAEMNALNELAKEYDLFVIEDAAQAMFSKGPGGYLGTQSDIGCFSLSIAKLISTGQGGMIVTKNKELCEKLKLVRNHGVVDNFTEAWNQFGMNFKFTDLLSSFGLVQLQKVKERINHVTAIYQLYRDGLDKLPFLKLVPVDIDKGEVPVWIDALCENKWDLINFLKEKGIQARPYSPNLHTSDYINNPGDFPNSNKFYDLGMYLPCGPAQPLENIQFVIDTLGQYQVKELCGK